MVGLVTNVRIKSMEQNMEGFVYPFVRPSLVWLRNVSVNSPVWDENTSIHVHVSLLYGITSTIISII